MAGALVTWTKDAFGRGSALFRSGDGVVRALCGVAVLMATSAVVHAVVYAFVGGGWSGPVTFRKPIVFGVSAALLSLSLASLHAHVALARRRLTTAVYVATIVPEVALITAQKWRGVPSHFNVATPFDSAVFAAMGALITVNSVVLAVWLVQLARARGVAPDVRAAYLPGLALVVAATVVGFVMVGIGNAMRGPSAGPEAMPVLAAWKVAHAVALHALQVLPVLGWALASSGAPLEARLRWARRGALGYSLVLVASGLYAALDLSRSAFYTHPAFAPTALLGASGLALLTLSFARALRPPTTATAGLVAVADR